MFEPDWFGLDGPKGSLKNCFDPLNNFEISQCMWIGEFACAPGISSLLSGIECPSGLGPKAPR